MGKSGSQWKQRQQDRAAEREVTRIVAAELSRAADQRVYQASDAARTAELAGDVIAVRVARADAWEFQQLAAQRRYELREAQRRAAELVT